MAIAKTSAGAKIATILVLIPIGILLWVAAPYVLPVWRWQNLDWSQGWDKVASQTGIPVTKLRTELQLVVRYAPRRGSQDDPVPWQIVTSSPSYLELFPEVDIDETNLLVRASILSDRDGLPPSKLWVGVGDDEKYFKVKAWRFPPGTFGKNKLRPVLVYLASTLERMPIGEAIGMNTNVKEWENDDLWETRNDGFGQ